jgi:Aminoglycoside-2''-adenylyltransferase
MAGRELADAEINELWEAWTPSEVAQRMSMVTAPWYVAAGWALELFTGEIAREHDDLEIAVPAVRFGEVMAAFPGFDWDVVGDGQVWPFPEQLANHHQTWLREPGTGRYRIDVFREPHVGDHWVCRRDASITLPYSELILRTSEGIPYAAPEVALLFKAKHLRDKDIADFQRVLPTMDQTRRSRLIGWLSRIHPGHPWIETLAIHRS